MHQTVEHRPYLKGKLEIHTITQPDGTETEAFTLASLASVLGVPSSTIEGRYVRTNAAIHKIDIRTGPGRPTRGFPMELLETIIAAFQNRNAKFNPADKPMQPEPEPGTAEYVEQNGERLFTPASLAKYYGVSISTVRNRIRDSGLSSRLVTIGLGRGGRPPVAFREADLPDVHLAIQHQITFENDEATRVARNLAGDFPTDTPVPRAASVPHPPGQLTSLTPKPTPSTSEPNLILDALRQAKMTSEFRQQKPTHSQLETEELTRELTEWLDTLPKTEPTVELTDVVIPRQTYDSAQAQWIQATDPYKWVEDELCPAIQRLLTQRKAPEYPWFETEAMVKLNGIGQKLGLTVSLPYVTEYVEAKRASLRQYLQPYEQLIVTAMDDFFPEGGQSDPVVALAFFRAMHRVPVYYGQIPMAEFETRIKSKDTKGAWQALRKPKNDTEQTAREYALDSPKFHEATAMFDAAFAQGIAECDKEHHTNTRLVNGWLEFPFDVTYDYRHRNHTP